MQPQWILSVLINLIHLLKQGTKGKKLYLRSHNLFIFIFRFLHKLRIVHHNLNSIRLLNGYKMLLSHEICLFLSFCLHAQRLHCLKVSSFEEGLSFANFKIMPYHISLKACFLLTQLMCH